MNNQARNSEATISAAIIQDLKNAIVPTKEKRTTYSTNTANQRYIVDQKDLSNKLSYSFYFVRTSLLALMRRQSVNLDTVGNRYVSRYSITPEECAQWKQTFKAEGDDIPYLFYLKSSTLTFFQFLADANINPKNVLQLRSELNFFRSTGLLRPGHYETEILIESIRPAGKKNAIFTAVARVTDDEGNELVKAIDHFMIRNISAEDMEKLNQREQKLDTSYRKWLIAPRCTQEELFETKAIFVPATMGIDYGFVSGDLNMVHTTNLFAKLFGFKRAFIQGLCCANIVLSQLPATKKMSKLNINFNKPIYTQSQIRIEYADTRFLVVNDEGTVLAHGDYR